jgi:hypothetical protein
MSRLLAPSGVPDLETAGQLLDRLDRNEWDASVALIEADRAAVSQAAKRELLKEILNEGKRRHYKSGNGSVGHTYDVVCELAAKYAAKEPA